MLIYRQLSPADLAAYSDLCRYCFEIPADLIPRFSVWVRRVLDYSWGAFEGDRLIAGMFYYPFSMRVGDAFLPMGGVAAVATVPEARNTGCAKAMMLRAHRQMRREGRALAVLRPFKHAFYARMGYGDVFHYLDVEFNPNQVALRPAAGYRLRAVDGGKNWRLLERIRHRYGRPYLGVVQRDKPYWEARLLFSHRGIRTCYLVEKNGEAAGYVITDLGPAWKSDVVRLLVVEAIWKDQGALNTVMGLLRSHRDQVKMVKWLLPVDVLPHDLMVDPGIEVKLKSKMMLKLVDVKRAIASRSYPSDLSGHVVIDLNDDDTSPWNTGRWSVVWDEGNARVTPFRGRLSRKGVMRCDAGALAILYSGRLSAGDLKAAGRIDANEEACALMDRAFPRGFPYMAETF